MYCSVASCKVLTWNYLSYLCLFHSSHTALIQYKDRLPWMRRIDCIGLWRGRCKRRCSIWLQRLKQPAQHPAQITWGPKQWHILASLTLQPKIDTATADINIVTYRNITLQFQVSPPDSTPPPYLRHSSSCSFWLSNPGPLAAVLLTRVLQCGDLTWCNLYDKRSFPL
jgi:hypothetical protein